MGESKPWWFVRDELRIQAYNMRSSMIAMNKVNKDKAACDKAYKKFWSEVESLDLACKKKELALAQKEYADVLAALKVYQGLSKAQVSHTGWDGRGDCALACVAARACIATCRRRDERRA